MFYVVLVYEKLENKLLYIKYAVKLFYLMLQKPFSKLYFARYTDLHLKCLVMLRAILIFPGINKIYFLNVQQSIYIKNCRSKDNVVTIIT